jgi:uncharacterized protein
MIVGVISDTHMRHAGPELDYLLDELLGDAEMLLHAGDIVSHKVLERLQERQVFAVCGNMDDYEIMDILPQTRIVPAAGLRIGLIHGWGSKEGLAERILTRFRRDTPDVIVYGHSHVPFWGSVQGVAMFNPGSASQNRHTGTGTVGILEIVDGHVEGRFRAVEY